MGEPATLTIDELTWLSATTLIDNHYTLPESPMSEVSFRSVFYDAKSENGIGLEGEHVGQESPPPAKPSGKPRRLRRHRNFYKPPQHQNNQQLSSMAHSATVTSTVTSANADPTPTPLQARGEELTSPTPGANLDPGANVETSVSALGKSITRSSEAGVQHTGLPITPPPTPPRRHMNPKSLSQPHQQPPPATTAPTAAHAQTQAPIIEQLPTPSPPSPSLMPSPSPSHVPSTPSRTFYQPQGLTQPEWIYRRPKPSPPHVQNHAQLSRHNSANPAIALSRHGSSLSLASSYSPSRSPSTPHTSSPGASSSKRRPHPMPCPSSPVLISSTSQLISVHPAEKSDSSRPCAAPSITANPNTSTSSLQLQSSIRVKSLKTPPKSRTHGAPPGNMSPSTNHAVPVIERCPSNSSLMSTATNVSTSTAMWSAMHPASLGKHMPGIERTKILKSIPSQSQMVLYSPVTPTFVGSPSAISSAAAISTDSPVSGSGTKSLPAQTPPSKDTGWRSGSVTRSLPPPPSPRSYLSKDKDTDAHSLSHTRSPRRNKFASAPPAPISQPGSSNPGLRPIPSSPSTSLASSSTAKAMRMTTSSSKNDLIIPDRCSRCGTPKSRIRSPSLTSNASIMTHTGTSTPEECEREGEINPESSYTESLSQPGISISSVAVPLSGRSTASVEVEYADQTPSYVHLHEHHSQHTYLGAYNDRLNGSAAVAARSQAYAKLTGKRHHPSTTPASISVADSVNGHIAHVYKSRSKHGYEQGSATTSKPISTSYFNPSLSEFPVQPSPHCGIAYIQSPQTPFTLHTPTTASTPTCQTYTPSSSLPKSKSILTRTSSMSTKNSACGATTKSVKFVEVPVVHYRSKCYEEEYADVGDSHEERNGVCDGMDLEMDLDLEDEGFSMQIEAIDMDIDTYLGICREEKEKEPKRSFMRQGSFKVGNILTLGGKREKEKNKEQDDKQAVADKKPLEQDVDKGKIKKEKDSEKSALGLKKLMNLATRKASPTLAISISSPIPLGSKPSTAKVELDADRNTTSTKKRSLSPPASPIHRPTISGPYALGSCSPPASRSRSPQASLPSPSPSPSCLSPHSLPLSPSDASLNRLPSVVNRQCRQQATGIVRMRSSSHRSVIGGKSKSGKMASDVLSLNNLPVALSLRNAPSYESFRSAKSCAGKSLLGDDVVSLKSAGGSIRNIKSWIMNRMGTVGDETGTATDTIQNVENSSVIMKDS